MTGFWAIHHAYTDTEGKNPNSFLIHVFPKLNTKTTISLREKNSLLINQIQAPTIISTTPNKSPDYAINVITYTRKEPHGLHVIRRDSSDNWLSQANPTCFIQKMTLPRSQAILNFQKNIHKHSSCRPSLDKRKTKIFSQISRKNKSRKCWLNYLDVS